MVVLLGVGAACGDAQPAAETAPPTTPGSPNDPSTGEPEESPSSSALTTYADFLEKLSSTPTLDPTPDNLAWLVGTYWGRERYTSEDCRLDILPDGGQRLTSGLLLHESRIGQLSGAARGSGRFGTVTTDGRGTLSGSGGRIAEAGFTFLEPAEVGKPSGAVCDVYFKSKVEMSSAPGPSVSSYGTVGSGTLPAPLVGTFAGFAISQGDAPVTPCSVTVEENGTVRAESDGAVATPTGAFSLLDGPPGSVEYSVGAGSAGSFAIKAFHSVSRTEPHRASWGGRICMFAFGS